MSAVAVPSRRTNRAPKRDETTTRPDLHVVPLPRPRHTLAFALVLILLAGATVFTTVSLNALAAGDAVEARRLDQAVTIAERENARLVAEVGTLENPQRIRDVATNDLGLVPARDGRFLVLDRPLPVDAVSSETEVGGTADPLKPVLSVER